MDEIISRVAFCQKCFDAGRPKDLAIFVTFNNTTGIFDYHQAKQSGKSGFTPHLFMKKRSENGVVFFQKICGMSGCGVSVNTAHDDFAMNLFLRGDHKTYKMRVVDWNALQTYKDPAYAI